MYELDASRIILVESMAGFIDKCGGSPLVTGEHADFITVFSFLLVAWLLGCLVDDDSHYSHSVIWRVDASWVLLNYGLTNLRLNSFGLVQN